MVVFGDEVTKILCNSLFTFFTEQGKTGKNGHMKMKILEPIFGILVALTKKEVTYQKNVMSRALNCKFLET